MNHELNMVPGESPRGGCLRMESWLSYRWGVFVMSSSDRRGHGDPELGSIDAACFSQSHKTQDHRKDKMEMRSQEERRQCLLILGEGIETCLCTC